MGYRPTGKVYTNQGLPYTGLSRKETRIAVSKTNQRKPRHQRIAKLQRKRDRKKRRLVAKIPDRDRLVTGLRKLR